MFPQMLVAHASKTSIPISLLYMEMYMTHVIKPFIYRFTHSMGMLSVQITFLWLMQQIDGS